MSNIITRYLDTSLQLKVASFLPLGSCRNLGLSSKELYAIFNDKVFWKIHCESLNIKISSNTDNYKEIAKDFYKRFNQIMHPFLWIRMICSRGYGIVGPIMRDYNFYIKELVQDPSLRNKAIVTCFPPENQEQHQLDVAIQISQTGPVIPEVMELIGIRAVTAHREDIALRFFMKNLIKTEALRDAILNHAALYGQEQLARLVLTQGFVSEFGRSGALQQAAKKGYENIVKLLFFTGKGSVGEGSFREAIISAIENNYENIVRFLLTLAFPAQAFPNQDGQYLINLDRECLIKLATEKGHQNLVKLLTDLRSPFYPIK